MDGRNRIPAGRRETGRHDDTHGAGQYGQADQVHAGHGVDCALRDVLLCAAPRRGNRKARREGYDQIEEGRHRFRALGPEDACPYR